MAHPYRARLIWSSIFPVDFAIGLSKTASDGAAEPIVFPGLLSPVHDSLSSCRARHALTIAVLKTRGRRVCSAALQGHQPNLVFSVSPCLSGEILISIFA